MSEANEEDVPKLCVNNSVQQKKCAIRNRFTNIFWGPAPTLSSFFTLHDPKVIARFLRECFEHRNTLVAAQSGHIL